MSTFTAPIPTAETVRDGALLCEYAIENGPRAAAAVVKLREALAAVAAYHRAAHAAGYQRPHLSDLKMLDDLDDLADDGDIAGTADDVMARLIAARVEVSLDDADGHTWSAFRDETRDALEGIGAWTSSAFADYDGAPSLALHLGIVRVDGGTLDAADFLHLRPEPGSDYLEANGVTYRMATAYTGTDVESWIEWSEPIEPGRDGEGFHVTFDWDADVSADERNDPRHMVPLAVAGLREQLPAGYALAGHATLSMSEDYGRLGSGPVALYRTA